MNSGNEKQISKKSFIIMVLGVLLLYTARIFFLENDFPAFGIGLYQPKDEGRYSMMALDYLNYGNLYTAGKYEIYTPPTFRVNVLQNFLQYVCMKAFGKNYYGFRLPSFLASLAIVLLCSRVIYCLFKRYYKIDKLYYIISVVVLLYFLTDFSFLLASKCAESSIFRAFSIALSLWIIFEFNIHEDVRFFLLGALSVFAVFFIYISNVTIGFAVMILTVSLFISKRRKENLNKLRAIISGGIIGFVCAEAYYIKVWKVGALQNIFISADSFSDRMITEEIKEPVFLKAFKGLFSFWGSNMFFFNVLVLILLLWSLVMISYYIIREKDENLFILLGLLMGFIVQSILIDDYNERKAITIIPAVIIIIVMGIIIFVNNPGIWKGTKRKYVKITIVGCTVFVYFCNVMAVLRRYELIYIDDFEKFDLYFLLVLNLILCFLITIICIMFMLDKNRNWIYGIMRMACIGVLVINLFFDMKYVYLYQHYTEKDAMIDIGNVIGNNYVIASYSIGFCLYNDIMPISNTEEKYREYIKEDDIMYFIDYHEGGKVGMILPREKYAEVAVFDRSIKCLGSYWPVAVYKKVE